MFGHSSHNAADRASIDTTARRNLNRRRLLELMDYQHHSDLLSCGRVGTNRAFIQIQRMPLATPKQRSNPRPDVKIFIVVINPSSAPASGPDIATGPGSSSVMEHAARLHTPPA